MIPLADGPVLRFGAPLTIDVNGGLAIDADTIALRARTSLNLASGGELSALADGALRLIAGTHDIQATRGAVNITANDDVAVDGERILLNCT